MQYEADYVKSKNEDIIEPDNSKADVQRQLAKQLSEIKPQLEKIRMRENLDRLLELVQSPVLENFITDLEGALGLKLQGSDNLRTYGDDIKGRVTVMTSENPRLERSYYHKQIIEKFKLLLEGAKNKLTAQHNSLIAELSETIQALGITMIGELLASPSEKSKNDDGMERESNPQTLSPQETELLKQLFTKYCKDNSEFSTSLIFKISEALATQSFELEDLVSRTDIIQFLDWIEAKHIEDLRFTDYDFDKAPVSHILFKSTSTGTLLERATLIGIKGRKKRVLTSLQAKVNDLSARLEGEDSINVSPREVQKAFATVPDSLKPRLRSREKIHEKMKTIEPLVDIKPLTDQEVMAKHEVQFVIKMRALLDSVLNPLLTIPNLDRLDYYSFQGYDIDQHKISKDLNDLSTGISEDLLKLAAENDISKRLPIVATIEQRIIRLKTLLETANRDYTDIDSKIDSNLIMIRADRPENLKQAIKTFVSVSNGMESTITRILELLNNFKQADKQLGEQTHEQLEELLGQSRLNQLKEVANNSGISVNDLFALINEEDPDHDEGRFKRLALTDDGELQDDGETEYDDEDVYNNKTNLN